MNKLFQVPSKVPAVDGSVPLAAVKGTILFCSEEREVVLDRSRCLSHSWSLMTLKTSLMGSLSGVKCSVILKVWDRLDKRIGVLVSE